ncbi:MAG: ABC transporter ATP-binding protein/permease [Chitinophagales bacterium]|nr:ABC transporter ATP-binding protein/permease [Chitinophagales bacterium]
MKSYLRLLSLMKPYRGKVLIYLCFNILAIVFSLFSILMLVPFLQILFDKSPMLFDKPQLTLSSAYIKNLFDFYLSKIILEQGKSKALFFFCILVGIVFLLKNLFRYLALYILAPLRNGLIKQLRDNLYQKILRLRYPFFVENSKEDILQRLTQDLIEIEYSLLNTLEVTIQSPLTIVVFLTYMLFTSYQLSFFVFFMILVMALFIGRVGKNLKRQSLESRLVQGNLMTLITETLTHIKTLKSYSAFQWISEKFIRLNHENYLVFNKIYRKRELSSPLTEFLAIIVVCIVLYYGGNLVLTSGSLSAESFIGFMVVFSQLIPPAKSFSSAYYEIQKGAASLDRIEYILSQEIENLEDTIPSLDFEKKITLSHISFTYPNQKEQVLDNISFNIEKGKRYALVGLSGSGKSTLFDILLQFQKPDSGHISLDGKSIDDLSLTAYRNLFAVVYQNPSLFSVHFPENISLSKHIDTYRYEKSMQLAMANDFAEMKPKNTEIVNIQDKFSGGEKQRLALARAFYHHRPIVLLDEATSALDSIIEKEMQGNLQEFLKFKTSLTIAHRLSTVVNSDEILLIHQGKLIAQGKHEVLFLSNDFYKQLCQNQLINE